MSIQIANRKNSFTRKSLGDFRQKTLVVLLASCALPGLAQTTLLAAADTAQTSLGKIVILGSNRPDQEALQSSSPVDIISADQLRDSGASTLSEALTRLSPAVNFPQNTTGPQAATNGMSIALHGLTPEQTLVLVNGKRLVAQPTLTAGNPPMFGYMGHPTDINIIPFSAIDHVEILKDGASALYGADAVAGVVNIVLKDRSHGGGFSAQVGNYTASQSPHGVPGISTDIKGWKGFELPGEGFLTLSAEANAIRQPEQGVASPNPVYAPAGAGAQGSQPAYDPLRHLMGYAGPVKDFKALANAEVGITDKLRYYGEASLAHIEKTGLSLTVASYQSTAVLGLFPQGRDDLSIITNDALTLQQGLRYKDEKLGDFDLGLNIGVNRSNTFNTLGYNQSLGLNSPIGLDTGTTRSSLIEASLNWVKEFEVGQFKPISVSAGVAQRSDDYKAQAGEWASWYVAPGATVGPGHYSWNAAKGTFTALNPNTPITTGSGISPANAGAWSRHVSSVYGDLEGRWTEKFSYGVAARLENYSDFNTVAAGKLSARYEVTPALALRSTLSNGFKAPSLIQENYQSTASSVAQGTLLVPSLALPTDSPLAIALGAKALKPEKSTNFSLGTVWQPAKNSSLSADAYHIRISDVINYSEALQDNGNGAFNAYLVSKGYKAGTIARFFVNGMDTTTSGIDIAGKHQIAQSGLGLWDLSLGYSYSRTTAANIVATPDALAGTGAKLISTVGVLGVTRATPNTKLLLGQKLSLQDWSFELVEKRYGTYVEALISTTPTPQTFAPQWIADLDIGYKIGKSASLHFGAKNLLDSYPDKEWASNRRVGQTNYPNLAPEGFAGRFVYANVSWTFN